MKKKTNGRHGIHVYLSRAEVHIIEEALCRDDRIAASDLRHLLIKFLNE